MVCANIIVSGKVQCVGYRAFVLQEVQKISKITGWVRNLRDGHRVEITAEGNESDIDSLIERLKQGPYLSEVKNVEIKKKAIKTREFMDFQISFTY